MSGSHEKRRTLPLPQSDLEHIFAHTVDVWNELRGKRIFVTGGTGFFGTWLIESFLHATDRLELASHMVVLSRDPASYLSRMPHLVGHPALSFHTGDVRDFDYPSGHFSHVIHAAVESDSTVMAEDPLQIFDVILAGTRHVLDFAVFSGTQQLLFTSSGAVYGSQLSDLEQVPETYCGAPNIEDIHSTYTALGEAKRAAETLCGLYWRQHRLESKIARCFTFIGPHLPPQGKFAVANFIRDAMGNSTIHVSGDGTPYRSYMYMADLMIWLWTILVRGRACHPYNVGSPLSISIATLARMVSHIIRGCEDVKIAIEAKKGVPPAIYVPSVQRAEKELNLRCHVSLDEAIRRTASWWKSVSAENRLPLSSLEGAAPIDA